jgi:hypothetical protein
MSTWSVLQILRFSSGNYIVILMEFNCQTGLCLSAIFQVELISQASQPARFRRGYLLKVTVTHKTDKPSVALRSRSDPDDLEGIS